MQTPTSLMNYTYDADGIRVSSSVDGVVTDYIVDKNRDYAQVLEERNAGAGLNASYVYGDDLISMDRSGVVSFYHYDGNGNTRQLSDVLENMTDTYVYDAFGIMLNQTGTTVNNYLYTGEQYDANVGFYYLRARYYDADIGRFITFDPFVGLTYDPTSLHKYIYTRSNPIDNIDPTGYYSIANVMCTVAIVSILSSLAIGTYSKLTGGDFSPDAAIYGISLSLTGSALAGSANLSTFLFSKMSGLSGGIFFRYTLIASLLAQKAVYGVPLGQAIGAGITFGAELCATATDKKLGYFAYGGPLVSAGSGAVGWSLTFYAGVVWNVKKIDDYRSYPIQMLAFGLTAGVGGWFGVTQTWFTNPSFSQYGQVTGVTIGNGVLPSGGFAVTWSGLVDIAGSGLGAVKPYLVMSWPPGQNVLLSLKAHGF